MAPKKLQKYCHLSQAIKAYDSEFYQALDDLCLLPLLRPGPNGVTFLYPEEKSLRGKIVNAAYSKNPEMAVKMVKALILRGCYKTPSAIHGIVSNALNHLIELKDNKWHSFTFKIPKNFETFDHRGNIFMLLLTGKGEIPLTGAIAPRLEASDMARSRKGISATGGSRSWDCGCDCDLWPSHRIAIANKMAKHYPLEYKDKKSNIYVKKVYAQLCILKKDYPDIYNADILMQHLGNEEISDSYLLDMISPEDVFCKIWKAMGQNADRLGEFGNDVVGPSDFYSKYIALKQSRVNQKFPGETLRAELQKNYEEQKRLINEIVSVSEFRTVLVSAYHNCGGKVRLGKDLFIVFTSVMKEMWEHEHDMTSYRHYVYMANNVFTTCEDMVNQEFNQFKDATLHGNLLKCDIFKFHPCTDMAVYASVYTLTEMPKPIELKIFSFNNVVNKFKLGVTGGAQTIMGGYYE